MATPVYIPGGGFLDDVLRALRIEHPVRNVVIRVPWDGAVTVEVERFAEKGDGERLIEVFSSREWVKVDEFKEPAP